MEGKLGPIWWRNRRPDYIHGAFGTGRYISRLCAKCAWSFQCPAEQAERTICRACEQAEEKPK